MLQIVSNENVNLEIALL